MAEPTTGMVLIGRNEGTRLVAALEALPGDLPIVYVDSASTDDSVAQAEARGAHIVHLDMSVPFSAARARNEGVARLAEIAPQTEYIMFLDGDAAMAEGWLETAILTLDGDDGLAAVCGLRRERDPHKNVFHSLAEREWNQPPGETDACGGDVLIRRAAFDQVGGYNPGLIAGEEPEMCLRMREHGWRILRLAQDMSHHDVAMDRLGPWWKRATRAGHAYAEVSDLHRSSPKRIWATETRRAILWGLIMPIAIVLGGLVVHPILWLGVMVYPLQVMRVARHLPGPDQYAHAGLFVLGRFAEAKGVLTYWRKKLTGRATPLMEYKG